MGPPHEAGSRSALRYVSLPSRLAVLVLLAGGIHAAALTGGIDRSPRQMRPGACAAASGRSQRLAGGSHPRSGVAPDGGIGPDAAHTLATAAGAADGGAPRAGAACAMPVAVSVLMDAGAAPELTTGCGRFAMSPAAFGRAPPTA